MRRFGSPVSMSKLACFQINSSDCFFSVMSENSITYPCSESSSPSSWLMVIDLA